jgi:hypothetical protein
MLPIIRQLHDAEGDRARARLLLAMPDVVVLKYAKTIALACETARFQGGSEFVLRRVTAMRATRTAEGLLPAHIADDFELFRTAFAAFAHGGRR